MTVIFENDNDVIVYVLENVIFHAKRTQQIFVAQCMWWLASIIGLERELINYIDKLQSRVNVTVIPEKVRTESRLVPEEVPVRRVSVSPIPRDQQEDQRRDQVLKECEVFLRNSKKQREVESLKGSGRTGTGQINPRKSTKDSFRVSKKRVKP
jgi:hypothetical protein